MMTWILDTPFSTSKYCGDSPLPPCLVVVFLSEGYFSFVAVHYESQATCAHQCCRHGNHEFERDSTCAFCLSSTWLYIILLLHGLNKNLELQNPYAVILCKMERHFQDATKKWLKQISISYGTIFSNLERKFRSYYFFLLVEENRLVTGVKS